LKKVDKDTLISLARIHASLDEMASALNVSPCTVKNRINEMFDMTYGQFMRHHKAAGKSNLRRAMWAKALKGDTKMQIFLSKQHLDMAEKIDHTSTSDGAMVDFSACFCTSLICFLL